VPRKPDPNLEQSIVEAALRLLAKQGVEAITMREVARAAGTTTPTIYERFKDRDALIAAVTDYHRDRLVSNLTSEDSLEVAATKFFDYCREHPTAVDLLLARIAANIKLRKRGPTYDIVRHNLMKVDGLNPKDAEEMTKATSAMIFGTALLVSKVDDRAIAREMERATCKMMRRLVASYKN